MAFSHFPPIVFKLSVAMCNFLIHSSKLSVSRRTGVLRGCKYYLVNVSEDNALQFNFLPRVVSNYARRINDTGSRLSDTKTDISRMGIFH